MPTTASREAFADRTRLVEPMAAVQAINSEMAYCPDIDQAPCPAYLGLEPDSLAAVDSAVDSAVPDVPFFQTSVLNSAPLRPEHTLAPLYPLLDFDAPPRPSKRGICIEDPGVVQSQPLTYHQVPESPPPYSGSIPDTSSDFSWHSACVSPAPSTSGEIPTTPQALPMGKLEALPMGKLEALPVLQSEGKVARHVVPTTKEKHDLRRKRNREASSRSYYRKKQRLQGTRETLEAEQARAAELQAREHELRQENIALRNEIKWRTAPRLRLPKSFKLNTR